MSNNTRIERPAQTIKSIVSPLTTETKVKVVAAFQLIVNKIKEKHLS